MDLKSNNKGLLIPRMDSLAIALLPSPANGLMVYDTVKTVLYIYNATNGGWQRIRPVETLNTIMAGTNAGDVVVWNGSTWEATPKCNLFTYYYRDKDGDGYGDMYFPVMGCAPLAGFVANGADCNDTSAAMHPNATEQCNGRDDNCNGQIDEGFNLLTDINNCGSCGNVCNLPHATTGCAGGQCVILSCNTGYGNCDGITANGCEVLLNGPNNCGACNTSCNVPNATASCISGTCQIAACNPGFANCDGIVSNGCEVQLQTNTNNCGTCGYVCSAPHATTACSGGNCVILQCDAGWGNCNGAFADGCEILLSNNVNNCNACGAVCSLPNASAVCNNGACAIGSCNNGYFDADGAAANGCELQAPQPLGSTASNLSSPAGVAVSGNYAFVINGNNTLTAYNISDPGSITFLSAIATNIATPKAIFVAAQLAYVVNGNNTLSIFNISNPSAMVFAGGIGTNMNNPSSIVVSGNFAYVTNANSNALTIFDVSNPASIVFKSQITSGLSSPASLVVSGTTAFVASNGNNALVAFNVISSTNPTLSGSISTNLSSPTQLTVFNGMAYMASGGNSLLATYDVSAPTAMVAKGTAAVSGILATAATTGIAYTLSATAPNLSTFNVTAPTAIASRSYTSSGLTAPTKMVLAGGRAYVLQGNNLLVYSLP